MNKGEAQDNLFEKRMKSAIESVFLVNNEIVRRSHLKPEVF